MNSINELTEAIEGSIARYVPHRGKPNLWQETYIDSILNKWLRDKKFNASLVSKETTKASRYVNDSLPFIERIKIVLSEHTFFDCGFGNELMLRHPEILKAQIVKY